MRRTFAVLLLAFFVITVPFYMTARTSGSGTQHSAPDSTTPERGRTYGDVNHPHSPGYEPDRRGGFDIGWLGLLGLAGLLGLRHTNRTSVVS